MKQTTKEIIKLIKFSQNKYDVIYNSELEQFYINDLNTTNVTLLKTNSTSRISEHIYKYHLNKNREATQKLNYLLKEKELNHTMIKDEYNEHVLNINNGALIIEFEKEEPKQRESEAGINLEYKTLNIPFKDLKQLCGLKGLIKFELKTDVLKVGVGTLFKEYKISKEIYIDFENKYKIEYIKSFLKFLKEYNIKTNTISFDIGRDAPLKIYVDDIKMFIAPNYEKEV